jgi:hypothetical protein
VPLKSKSQMRWMAVNHPNWLHEWASATPNIKKLPEKAPKKKKDK